LVVVGIVAAVLQVDPAAAETVRAGRTDLVVPQQEQSLEAIRDYDQLIATLENMVQSSQGAATLAYAPYRRREAAVTLPYVTIGDGPPQDDRYCPTARGTSGYRATA